MSKKIVTTENLETIQEIFDDRYQPKGESSSSSGGESDALYVEDFSFSWLNTSQVLNLENIKNKIKYGSFIVDDNSNFAFVLSFDEEVLEVRVFTNDGAIFVNFYESEDGNNYHLYSSSSENTIYCHKFSYNGHMFSIYTYRRRPYLENYRGSIADFVNAVGGDEYYVKATMYTSGYMQEIFYTDSIHINGADENAYGEAFYYTNTNETSFPRYVSVISYLDTLSIIGEDVTVVSVENDLESDD